MIDAVELVPGDVVNLNDGDRVPADIRIIRANELKVRQCRGRTNGVDICLVVGSRIDLLKSRMRYRSALAKEF